MSHVESMRVGPIEIGVVCQGYAALDLADECPGNDVDWSAERERHDWAFLDGSSWPWHVHAFVVHGRTTAVVDTGTGSYGPYRPWAPGSGRGADESFAEAGVDVGAVELVVLSHLHADHAGGVWAEDGPRFPNARYVVHEADVAFFADRHEPYAAVPELARLDELGMLDTDPDDREVAPGVRVVHTPGHTPGHRSVVLDAGRRQVLLTGDLLHLPVQAAHPSWPSSHDVDPSAGALARTAILAQAAEHRWLVGVPHFARPFGRLDGEAWRSEGPAS